MEGQVPYIALFCNPLPENEKAFRVTETVAAELRRHEVRFVVYSTSWPAELPLEPTAAWIVGGDGTLNHFINQYPDVHLPLSVFAGGTGNDFHWMLYGNLSVEQQVKKVLSALPRQVDCGVCNGRRFINGVGIGFDGAIVKDLLGKKKLAGKASYMLSILKHIVGYQEKHCTIVTEGETFSQDSMLVSVANARRYGGGFHVAPRAVVDDGLLDLNVVGRINPLGRVKYLPVMERGEHLDLPFVRYCQEKKVTITSGQGLHAHLDGEYLFTDRFEIEVLPASVRFLY
jgi:diacylglycerol kinase (ATP)